MMKILFVEPHESSLFSFRKELLDTLLEEKHEIVLCIDSTQKIVDCYQNKVTKIINVPMNLKDKGIFSNLLLKRKYRQIIKEEKPDLILSYKIKPNIYCGLCSKRVPMIANITGLGNLFKKETFSSKIGITLYRAAFKNVDYIFFQNEDGLNFFKKNKIKINNYRIIPGSGVNVSLFVPTRIKNHESTNFLFASRAIYEKGFELLLDAIPLVVKNNDKVHFNFLSAEEDIFADKKARMILDKYSEFVTVLKRTNNMSDIYSDNDFLVAPSFYREGISNVLLESLACGRPIITTSDNPGCKEVLEEGKNGFGVISNNLDSLVNALLKAASLNKKEIEKMGQEGRDFVIKHFDRMSVIRNYTEVIDIIKKDNL